MNVYKVMKRQISQGSFLLLLMFGFFLSSYILVKKESYRNVFSQISPPFIMMNFVSILTTLVFCFKQLILKDLNSTSCFQPFLYYISQR